MKIDYIDFFSRQIPEWMARSNQKSQEVGFGTDAYWQWAVSSIGEICKQYNDDELVTEQFGLLFNWLEKQAGKTMEYSKQTIIESFEHSIEKTKNEIEKYSKDCNGRFAQRRTAHREFLKKQLKKMEAQLEELKNEHTRTN